MKRSIVRFLNQFYLENAAGYFAGATALVTSYSLLINPSFGILTPATIAEGKWWSVALYAFRFLSPSEAVGNGFWVWFSLGIHSYVLLVVGRLLENLLESPRFNLYLWSAIFHVTIGGVLSVYYPLFVETRSIYICMIIGIAILIPESEIFIIPIKMKWIGAVVAVYVVGSAYGQARLTGSYLPLLGLYFSYANLILFFGKGLFDSLTRKKRGTAWVAKQREVFAIHKCYICGATEVTDPQAEFRYCVDCEDQEYCDKHLHNHTHIRSKNA
ncbi:hypothetical protein ACE5IS_01180 [Leptospira wolffii]|uniref:Rhomboid family intramembrane serine protease n=1 Tax=Leptospira wolffii TaxID=409998 RepID=A0ABV5BMV9_9LEPT|nr:hypothetical protein [Leptospira wolffii]TGL49192.1 hypothetical protein EHQ61_12045 [Leptospira wolffii]